MTQPSSLDLGVIGNAAVAALIDRDARLIWMCTPRMDGDPIFCRLLKGEGDEAAGGAWSITIDDCVSSQQAYLRNTAILETTLTDKDGNTLRIRDFAPRFKRAGRIFRPVAVTRIIEPISGTPRVTVAVDPLHDYGARVPETTRGSSHVRFLLGSQVLRLTTDAPVDFILRRTPFVVDRPYAFVLGPDETLTTAPAAAAQHSLEKTREYWVEWVRYLSLPVDWQDVVIRSAITLKLCSNEESGAIMAALTTSIPEYGESGRTWDYRFCWLRDAFFTVKALNALGATKTMEDYLAYVVNVVAGSSDGYLQPLFGIGLERHVDERVLGSLAGYRNLGPVRSGNAAYTQVQNDGYGSVILATAQCFFDERLPDMGGAALFRRLEPLGEQAVRRWDQPDAGIWEFRTRNGVHTHSSLMCWAACDRLAKIAGKLGLAERAAYWRGHAETIRKGLLDRAWNEKLGHFTSTFGGADLDASLLLFPEIGIVQADDPRFVATLEAIEKHLRFGNHLYRYRAPDDFGEPETAFTACTFWLIDALARAGRDHDARDIFADVLERRNHLGLLSEGLHVDTGELWGNFPQTYSMVGLINAAMRLSRRWEEVL
ncbi:glucoamylase [Mesorhizobium sp. L-8-10]|uniref:glycoside hydrolase family 15 protein n=1 Tax=unclassified Mesorhizobium TaxID=325217 RepID=UPI00192694C5|nr:MULTISPECIES: glycoside hydrolase family 15 protein [unclassified Mesorhizobium]BCH26064.1 glucoamylase [Mesorhizobium sp. L-8-3]BCH34054.1 glucoamylase [Mesorhizobium sp. L-8-10]